MYKNINSASRIHTILTKAMGEPDKALFVVLASVFEMKGKNDAETGLLILPQLHWFFMELELLESQARSSSVSVHLYEPAFLRIRSVISPLHLQAGWHGLRGNLTADVLLAIAFLNEFLPNEEGLVPEEELAAIRKSIDELKDQIEKSGIPAPLRKFIDHQIQLIEFALLRYPISGARALREAGHAGLGEIIGTQGTIKASAESPEILSKLEKLWKHVNSAADTALKSEKLGQLGSRAWEALSNWVL